MPVVVYSGSALNQVLLRTFSVRAVLAEPTDPHDLLNALATATASGSNGA